MKSEHDLSNDEIDGRITDLSEQMHILRNRLVALRAEKRRLGEIRAKRGRDGPRVTDHALLQYIERKKGIDINEMRVELRKELCKIDEIWRKLPSPPMAQE
ncbi:MAG: hypothetical protein KGL39_57680 [Patescibacteria group bacterium]|nr:hypothetical protein [Patescibacteria group bacterium]